jgi:hypothetical protein
VIAAPRVATDGHTLRVARRVTSRQLVGRTDQLAALRSATDAVAVGESRVILIAGDAGIGKTRLVTEAAEQARGGGFVVAVGGCVQLGELSVAYAPLVEALRDLRGQLGEDEFATLSGPGAAEIGALLGGAAGPSASGSGPLFEHLLAFLTRLGQRQHFTPCHAVAEMPKPGQQAQAAASGAVSGSTLPGWSPACVSNANPSRTQYS